MHKTQLYPEVLNEEGGGVAAYTRACRLSILTCISSSWLCFKTSVDFVPRRSSAPVRPRRREAVDATEPALDLATNARWCEPQARGQQARGQHYAKAGQSPGGVLTDQP